MSAFKAAVLQCDSCNRRYGVEDYATLEGIRARAKARGWLTRRLIAIDYGRVKIAQDYCPKCLKPPKKRKSA